MASRKVDVCIIGCGAGGATLTMRLAEAGFSVVALEAGPFWDPARDFTNDIQAMRQKLEWDMPVTFAGNPEEAIINTRGHTAWGVGGGTNHWTCAVGRLHPTDFRTKSSDAVGADWPIRYADLEPYYLMAERQLGVSTPYPAVTLPQIPRAVNPPHKLSFASQAIERACRKLGIHSFSGPTAINSRPYDGRPACNYCGFCDLGCQIRANGNTLVTHIPRAIAAGAEVRPDCFAHRIELNESGLAKSVLYFDANGREHEQEAAVVALACYAVETPRLLLNSTSRLFPNGLGNSSGLVGKNLMSHVTVRVDGVCSTLLDSHRGYPVENLVTYDFYNTDEQRGFARGYKVSTHSLHPRQFVMLERMLWGEDLKRHAELYRQHYGLVAIGESLPNDANTVTLDPVVKDRFGVPVARMTHVATDHDRRMARHSESTCKAILGEAGFWKTYVGIRSGHLMGTCRMGNDPDRSVVSPFGKCHDVKNLFIADSSVFVTGGAVNPTLTIVALANRVAEYVLRERQNYR